MTAGMPTMRGKRGRERRLGEGVARSPGSGARRQPDLSALLPLLADTGTFASLRERLVASTATSTDRPPCRSRDRAHTGRSRFSPQRWPRVDGGERLAWVARDAEIGDRVAEELTAWLGDAAAIAVLEPRTALAYERSELVADETAARVAALSAWRSGAARVLVASVQALVQHTIAPDDLPAEPRRLRIGARIRPDALLHELLAFGYVPTTEVAGRGEFARRGGLVDVFPPSAPLPVRIEFFGDEIESLRAFDPTDQRTVGPLEEAVLLPASEFLAPHGGVAALRDRARTGRRQAPRAARRGPRALRGRRGRRRASAPRTAPPPRPGRSPSATPPRSGPPTSRRRPASTTSTPRPSSSSTSPARSPRPPRSSGARPTSAARS